MGVDHMDIVRVAEKLSAFREAYPPTEYAIRQDFAEDVVGSTSRVTGHCRIIAIDTGAVLAEAYGTRALREPVPGAQGHRDTRDPDRAMTQALGRALGLLGYADANGIEGDTDEPDETRVTRAAAPPPPPPVANPVAVARQHLTGEVVADDTLDLDLVDTLELRDRLNGLAPGDRGNVRAVLIKHGYGLPLPDQMNEGRYQALTNIVNTELAALEAKA